MPKKFLEAGKIVGTHGIRGDLKVQSWCDTPEVLCDFDTLYLDEKTPVEVKSAQVHKNVVLMHLKGVDTVEAAESCAERSRISTAMMSICPRISFLFRIFSRSRYTICALTA